MSGGLAVVLLLLAGAGTGGAGDSALLPPDGFAGGWVRGEPARAFPGAELYGHIDGGAELFLEFGFDVLTLQRYREGETTLALEIYRMADPEAALGIYLQKCGRETPDPGFPERHTVGRYQLELVKGRYYVRITRDPAEGPPAALLDHGRFVAERIAAAQSPAALGLLPRQGLLEGTLRLIRGPYALQSVAGDLGEGDLLLLRGQVTAAAGDYRQTGGSAFTRILADYPSLEAAEAAFASLRRSLDPRLKVLVATPARLEFKDPAGKFGLATVAGRRLEIQLHLLSR